jgi:hypothetical protein
VTQHQKRAGEELKEQPKINEKPAPKNRVPLTERIDSIIADKFNKSKSIKKQIEEQKIKKEMDQCTFRPHINRPLSSNYATNPLDRKDHQALCPEKPPAHKHEELLKWAEDKNKRIAESAISHTFDSVSKNSRKLASKDIEKSADRLYSSYIEIEKKKLDMQVKELDAHSFRPVINKKSQMLAENKRKALLDHSEASLPIKTDRKDPSFSHKDHRNLNLLETSTKEPEVARRLKDAAHEEIKPASNKYAAEKSNHGSKSPVPAREKSTAEKPTTPKTAKREGKAASVAQTQPSENSNPKAAKKQGSNKKKGVSNIQSREESEAWNLINRDSPTKSNQKVQYHTLSYLEKQREQEDDILMADGDCTYEEYYNSTVDRMNRMQMNPHELKLQDSLGLIELIPLEKDCRNAQNSLAGLQPKPKALKAINDLEKQIMKATQLVYSDNLSKPHKHSRSVNESFNSSREKKLPAKPVEKQTLKCDSTCETTLETSESPQQKAPLAHPQAALAQIKQTAAARQPKASDAPAGRKIGQESLLAIMKELCQAVDEASR